MNLHSRQSGSVILLFASAALLLFLLVSQAGFLSNLQHAFELDLAALGGGVEKAEILQDFIGMRGLVSQTSSYPVLGKAFHDLGIQWEVEHRSTHPPTAFLLVAPFAFLPLNVGTAVWAWLMVALLYSTLLCYGFSWKASLAMMPPLLLWPPMAQSLEQLTIVWMWGVAMAFRLGQQRPLWGGIGIGIASLTKLLPGLMIVVFLLRRKWNALLGFLAIWIAAVLILIGLNQSAITDYLRDNRSNSLEMIARSDNAALLVNVYRYGGVPASILAVLLFALLLFTHKRFFATQPAQDSLNLWMLFSFLSVALLPVAWIYSIVPLLPVILFLMRRGKLLTTFVAICVLLLPCLIPPFGDITVLPLGAATALVGIGLMFDVLPWKLFTATSLRELASAHQG